MKRPRPKDLLVAGAVLLFRRLLPRRRARFDPGEREPVVPPGEPSPRAELLVLGLLAVGAACAVAFVVVYAVDGIPAQTQLLGLSLGLAFLFIAAALIATAQRLIVTEEVEDDYPEQEHLDEQKTIGAVLDDSGSRLTRRRLFKLGLLGAGGALGVALLAPLASLGPALDLARSYATPWRRGRRLVDEHGKPYRASDIEEKSMYTAFAEGSDKEELGSSLVLVRLTKKQLKLPPENAGYDADGIVAYSKICTHAGCAISLYRTPLFPPDEPGPALVCPCHYSTFDPSRGGDVTFGPAGRKLPMLPIYVDRSGLLRARGNFDEPVGPSWSGVRMKGPT
jgi:ubiquinol-cytochrome c reductase iron-sulfur subunit